MMFLVSNTIFKILAYTNGSLKLAITIEASALKGPTEDLRETQTPHRADARFTRGQQWQLTAQRPGRAAGTALSKGQNENV